MKHLLLSLSVLAMLVSCGKDKGSNTVAPATSNAVTLNDATAVTLGNLINTSETTFAAVPTNINTANAKYYYSTTVAAAQGSNCTQHTSGGWIKFTYYTCSSSGNSNQGSVSSVPVASVDLAAKRAELTGYINSSTAGAIYQSGTTYFVRVSSGVVYTIDTRFPIQANPVQVQDVSGQLKTYLGINY